jgi:hypothetical protein
LIMFFWLWASFRNVKLCAKHFIYIYIFKIHESRMFFWFCCGSRMLSRYQNPFLCNDFFSSLLRLPHNQIANVDSLPKQVISGGLHWVGGLGGLQFAHICMECVWLLAMSFARKGLIRQGCFFVGEFLFLLQFSNV